MSETESRQARDEAEATLADINKKTGRNMPQAVGTAVVLVALLVAAMLVRFDLLVWLIVVFLVLALWELRVDFAAIGLHLPVVALWVCCAFTLLATYYMPRHVLGAALGAAVSLVVVSLAASVNHNMSGRITQAVASKPRSGGANAADAQIERPTVEHVVASAFIVLYIAVLASCIILPFTFGGHQVAHAIIVIFLPAISDTGGLFAGAWFGKHKLSPRISPKKSVEGLVGSVVLTMVAAFVIFAITYSGQWASRWWVPVLIGIVVGVVGTFGDLCASMLKRDIGIKDMGHLLKGHGGVMDRVDSILLCAPFLTLILWTTGL